MTMKKTKTPPQSQDLAAEFLPQMDAERKKKENTEKLLRNLQNSLAMCAISEIIDKFLK